MELKNFLSSSLQNVVIAMASRLGWIEVLVVADDADFMQSFGQEPILQNSLFAQVDAWQSFDEVLHHEGSKTVANFISILEGLEFVTRVMPDYKIGFFTTSELLITIIKHFCDSRVKSDNKIGFFTTLELPRTIVRAFISLNKSNSSISGVRSFKTSTIVNNYSIVVI